MLKRRLAAEKPQRALGLVPKTDLKAEGGFRGLKTDRPAAVRFCRVFSADRLPSSLSPPKNKATLPSVAPKTLTLEPIGFIRSTMRLKFDAPSQPRKDTPDQNIIELTQGRGFEQALQDLKGFDRIWLIWWFDRNTRWRPMVLPPRGAMKRRGVFATRSPHRPCPIGITSTELISVKGRILTVGAVDLVDGTPILDIKPYISSIDAFPEVKNGWVDDIPDFKEPLFSVTFSALATSQLAWLKESWGIDFQSRAIEILSKDPSPHRTRRITRHQEGKFKFGCGAWKMIFSVQDKVVLVEQITRGYPMRLLHKADFDQIPDRDAQVAFEDQWPE